MLIRNLPYSGALGSAAGRSQRLKGHLCLAPLCLSKTASNVSPSLLRKTQPAATVRTEPFENSLGVRYGLFLQPTAQGISENSLAVRTDNFRLAVVRASAPGKPLPQADLSLPIPPQRNSPVRRSPGRDPMMVLFGTETPCNGLSTKHRIMFFAAAIGGRLYGKEQTQADA